MTLIVLPSNRPPARFYRGGAGIAGFRGETGYGAHEPEDWVASTTTLAGEDSLGLTTLPDGRRLVDAVEADPVGWLGADHVARRGADTGLLVKLLDAGQRLPVHAHPHDDWAAEHVGRAHGKAEAWYILRGGAVHLALREDIDPVALRTLVAEQDTDTLLGLLHRREVGPGDVVFVPPGVLHAIGEGVLILEVQQPEDLSILLEWRGFDLDGERHGHLGVGFDVALGAVETRGRTEAEVDALLRRGTDGSVLPVGSSEYFRLERLEIHGAAELAPGFAVLAVLGGELETDAGVRLPPGTTAVLPHSAGPLRLTGDGELLVARPPA